MLNSVIDRLKTGTYTVTRTSNGVSAMGRYTAGAVTTFTMDAIVQPLTPRIMLPLPEGVRSEDVRLVHTASLMHTQDATNQPDVMTIGGEPYYVWRVAGPYQLRGNIHYEAHVARRVKP